jgi:hypothetical protein
MSPVTDVWGKSGGQSQQVSRPASSLAQRTTQLSGMWVVLNGVQRADQVAMVAAQVGKLAIPMQVRAYACDTRHTNVQYVQGTMYLLKYTVESVSANAGAEQATLSRLIQELMPSGECGGMPLIILHMHRNQRATDQRHGSRAADDECSARAAATDGRVDIGCRRSHRRQCVVVQCYRHATAVGWPRALLLNSSLLTEPSVSS